MRPVLAFLLVLACAGCGPDGRPAGYEPDDEARARTDANIALANQTAPNPPALPGSSSPDAVSASAAPAATVGDDSAISPVPSFHGGDADWRVDIQSVGDLRHDVTLQQGRASMRGTLTYRAVPGEGGSGPFDLDGALYAPQGDAPMHVHLQREACLDAGGAHAWKVQVYVDGQAPRSGCGDMAM